MDFWAFCRAECPAAVKVPPQSTVPADWLRDPVTRSAPVVLTVLAAARLRVPSTVSVVVVRLPVTCCMPPLGTWALPFTVMARPFMAALSHTLGAVMVKSEASDGASASQVPPVVAYCTVFATTSPSATLQRVSVMVRLPAVKVTPDSFRLRRAEPTGVVNCISLFLPVSLVMWLPLSR